MKCPSCGYENSEDARYCNMCQKSFAKANTELGGLAPLPGLRPEPSKEAAKAVQGVPRSQSTGENWFQRHLNWTWVFAAFGVAALHLAVVLVYTFSALAHYSSIDQFSSSGSLFSFITSMLVLSIILLVLQALATYGVGAWVLKRKDRSLWWLLIFVAVIPIAWLHEWLGAVAGLIAIIWFLCLQNRNLLEELPESPSSSIQPGLASQGLGSQYRKYGP